MTFFFIFLSILFGAVAQISMKYGANGLSGIAIYLNPYVILGLGLYGISSILWIYALPKVELSFAYPMVSLGYVMVFVLSYFIFHDSINALRICGLITIIAGVIMISRS